jgi:hypothetical protein
VLPGEAGQQVGRQDRRVGERLVEQGADRRSARRRARADSSKLGSLNPRENVLTLGPPSRRAIAAVTAALSIPPERKTPSGTSAMRRRPTASVSDWRMRSIQ